MFNSIMNLLNTNNGMFKSEKQKQFMFSQSENGQIVTFGNMHDKSWTDFFDIDEIGVVAWTRRMQKTGKMIDKWNREGTASEQIKNNKRVDNHNAKVEKHNLIAVEAEKYYNQLCVEQIGYVVDLNKLNELHSNLQIYTSQQKLMEFVVSASKEDLTIMAENLEQFKTQTNELNDMVRVLSNRIMDIRIMVQTKYPSKFSYNFM